MSGIVGLVHSSLAHPGRSHRRLGCQAMRIIGSMRGLAVPRAEAFRAFAEVEFGEVEALLRVERSA